MKTISANLGAHLAGEVTTLATCWKMTLKDNTILGFTDHNKNLIIDSITYLAATGFTPDAIQNSDDLSVDNIELAGLIDSSIIKEEEIIAGKYDFAEIEVFKVNYGDLSQGRLNLSRGWIGEITFGKHQFLAEVRGLTQKLTKKIGELYSPLCRANLGDSRCKVNLAGFTVTSTITSVTSRQVFTDTSRSEDDGWFNFGKFTFTSGANNGLSLEVKEFVNDQFVMVLPFPYDITVGNTYSLVAGCDKTFETCIDKFSNAINFRGEPHIPGTDRVLETAGTRSEF